MRASEWCKLPYPNHPRGCPNYNKRDTCPPRCPTIIEVFDLSRQHWFIIEEFDLQAHMERMRQVHPKWSRRQLANCLYWQKGVRFRLMANVRDFAWLHQGTIFTLLPEALGVQVILTARKVGIPMEIKPERIVRKIALVGYPIDKKVAICQCSKCGRQVEFDMLIGTALPQLPCNANIDGCDGILVLIQEANDG